MAFYTRYMPAPELFWKLFSRVETCVRRHERKRAGRHHEDCYVRGDNLGPAQILFYVISLRVLTPKLVADLRKILTGYPKSEIICIVFPPDGEDWPEMGIRIRAGEVVDDLQRQYFPPEFQNLHFEGERRGVPADWEIGTSTSP